MSVVDRVVRDDVDRPSMATEVSPANWVVVSVASCVLDIDAN